MRRVGLALLALAIVLFEAIAEPVLRIGGIAPELPWIFVAYTALWGRRHEAAIAALVTGTSIDILSADPFGAHLAPLLIWTRFLSGCADRRWTEHPLPLAVLLFASWPPMLALRATIIWLVDGIVPSFRLEALSFVSNAVWTFPSFSVLHAIASRVLEPGRDMESKGESWSAGV